MPPQWRRPRRSRCAPHRHRVQEASLPRSSQSSEHRASDLARQFVQPLRPDELGLGVVVGTTNPKHMASDHAALHGPILTATELTTLSGLRAAVPSVRILAGWPDVMMPLVAFGTWPGSVGTIDCFLL